jgi:hypothetical protein
MPYETIHVCPKQCMLFRNEHVDNKYYVKCGSSRYIEVDSGDGNKKQLTIPTKVIRYLPFLPRLQRLYMFEGSAKQMTWHKHGHRYHPNKMVHPSDGEAWKALIWSIKIFLERLGMLEWPLQRMGSIRLVWGLHLIALACFHHSTQSSTWCLHAKTEYVALFDSPWT